MTRLVIDASVLIKLFIPEEGSREATAAVKATDALLAPDLLWPEVGNVLWKYVRRDEMTATDAEQITADMLQMPIQVFPTGDLVESALKIALDTARTVYDCVYLALAIDNNCFLATADARFVNVLASTQFARFVRHVSKIR